MLLLSTVPPPLQKFTLGLIAWTLLLGVAVPASASDPNAEVRANALYKDAKDQFDAGELDDALRLATQAEGLFAHPAIVYLRGRVLRRLGRLREADDAMRAADTSTLPKPLQKPLQDERAAMAEEMRVKGELTLKTDPDTAHVSLDGQDVAAESATWVAAGKHKVVASAPGFQTLTRPVDVVAGETAAITLRLLPVAGSLVIVIPGGLRDTEVRLDGLLVELKAGEKLGDRTPPMHVQAGAHRVVCTRGDQESAHEIEVGADGATEVTCDGVTPPTGLARKVVGWTGVGLGAGLTGLGAYGLLSFLVVDTKDPRYNDPRYTVGHQKVIWGSVYAGAGIALGLCSWFFLVRDPAPTDPRHAARPTGPTWHDGWAFVPTLLVGPSQ